MNIHIKSGDTRKHETAAKAEVLNCLEHKVKEWMESHIAKRKLWYSSDFLPADEKNNEDTEAVVTKLRNRVKGLKDSVRVALAVNLLTEEGLPHFHRLLAVYLGDNSFWSKWNNMWTAEEDRHGGVLRDYARDSRVFNFKEIEMMQFYYQEAGFNPEWDKDPYRVFVYTTLQERATQTSHKNTGKKAGDEEPLLDGILSSIAADEARHFTFYRNVFKEVLELDPNRAMISAAAIMPSINMPGATMPNFREMADIIRRDGIYGPRDYLAIVEEAIKFWRIEFVTGLNEAASRAQENILAIPKRLKEAAEYIERRSKAKTFSFDFIYNRLIPYEG